LKIPKKFKLKGRTWTVRTEADLSADGYECDGICIPEDRLILLNSDLPQKKRRGVFLHELFHAVIYEAHIHPGVRWSGGLEEVFCDAFKDVIESLFEVRFKRKKTK